MLQEAFIMPNDHYVITEKYPKIADKSHLRISRTLSHNKVKSLDGKCQKNKNNDATSECKFYILKAIFLSNKYLRLRFSGFEKLFFYPFCLINYLLQFNDNE